MMLETVVFALVKKRPPWPNVNFKRGKGKTHSLEVFRLPAVAIKPLRRARVPLRAAA